MALNIGQKIMQRFTQWLLKDVRPLRNFSLSDFDKICYEIRSGDVLLIEGRTRVSEVIGIITQSPWTHSALYIGRLEDIEDSHVRNKITEYYKGDVNEQLIIESLMGQGTIINPLSTYKLEHVRLCRPHEISKQDTQQVIKYCVYQLGTDYDIRQIFDLARFLFPWHLWPRRWRSSLFKHNAGRPTRESCATLLAEAFASVKFPVLPLVKQQIDHQYALVQRNPRLFSPSDFDFSPYFDIIKYPMIHAVGSMDYHKLKWDNSGLLSDE